MVRAGVKYSVVVPCYNEEGNAPHIVGRFAAVLAGRVDVEVLFVNDGSRDATEAALKAAVAGHGDMPFGVVSYSPNGGYGHAMQQGLAAAKGDVLAWTHADMQTDPADVLAAFEVYEREAVNGPVLVKGKRRNRKPLEAGLTFGMQVVAWWALRTYLDDINAQPKVFDRAFYEEHVAGGKGPKDFSLDLYLLYMAKATGVRIVDFPVDFGARLHGESKGGGTWKGRMKLIRRTFAYIFELRRRLK